MTDTDSPDARRTIWQRYYRPPFIGVIAFFAVLLALPVAHSFVIVVRDLIGINSVVEWGIPVSQWLGIVFGLAPGQVNVREYVATAIMPDPEWLRQVIGNDRLRSSPPPESPTMRP